MLRIILAGAALAAVFLNASGARAQSFDCSKAHYPDERAVCRQPDLGALDNQLNAVFGRVMNRLTPPERSALRRAEDGWVLSRRQCGTDHDCIERAYHDRMRQLAAMAPKQEEEAAPVAAAPEPRQPERKPETAAEQTPARPKRHPAASIGSSTPPPMPPPPASAPAPAQNAAPRSTKPTIEWVDPPPISNR